MFITSASLRLEPWSHFNKKPPYSHLDLGDEWGELVQEEPTNNKYNNSRSAL